ncbi:prepilin-type N-terminal cleavage/methylation domain-containing protein [candidate division WOR-3 bacterium]|jgi:prepilin-type N-terminal cleavage/methylation domain-containing protein|nr:prepilin-type N-terminal cleavage/methylation domain-containing protein [candidate division WOR-3 bacterium]
MNKLNEGFTIIELLVVVLMIGVITAIIFSTNPLLNIKKYSKDDAISKIKTVMNTAEMKAIYAHNNAKVVFNDSLALIYIGGVLDKTVNMKSPDNAPMVTTVCTLDITQKGEYDLLGDTMFVSTRKGNVKLGVTILGEVHEL